MVTKYCHHLQLHLALTSQMPLSTAGTSAISQAYRQIRTNLDLLIVYPLVNRDNQTILSQLFGGESFSFVRDLMRNVENEFHESPSDSRLHRPYLAIGLSSQTNKALKFRSYLFHLANTELMPYWPVTFFNENVTV